MRPPVFLANPADLERDAITLAGAEGRHATTVRRLSVGERADVTSGAGAVARQRASALPARSPRHRATQRSACQATTASTPTSVMISTASSPRSPFGIA